MKTNVCIMPDFLQKSISLQKSIFLRLTLIWKCNFWGTRVKCVIIKWFNNLLSETVSASFNSVLIIKWNGLISFILSRKFGANFEGASLTYLTSGTTLSLSIWQNYNKLTQISPIWRHCSIWTTRIYHSTGQTSNPNFCYQ